MKILQTLAIGLLAFSMAGCLWDKPQEQGVVPVGGDPPPVDQAPSISGLPTEATVIVGDLLQITPTATDPEGDPLTFEIENMPAWASFSTATGSLTGTPTSANVGTFSDVRISVRDSVNVTSGQ